MTEIKFEEKEFFGQNKFIPDIKPDINNNKGNEDIIGKEEFNASKISMNSKDTKRALSDKIFETENLEKNQVEQKINEESKSINYNQNKINNNMNMNIFDNKLYFTEANIPNTHRNTSEKSSSSKLYTIEVIPEKPQNSIMSSKIASSKSSKTENKKFNFSNNVGPVIELKRRVINRSNLHPLQYKIKEIEEIIKKQNDYDFKKSMKELEIKYEQKKKEKQRNKIITDNNLKFQKKIKEMEEFRNNVINKKWIKIFDKQNKTRKNNNKSFEFSIKDNWKYKKFRRNKSSLDLNLSEKEDKDTTLPTINIMQRYEYIKLKKEKNEEDFCNQALKKIQQNEENHRKNYLRRLNSLNRKLLSQNKLYRQKSFNCIKRIQLKDEELKQNYIKKDILKSYSINKIISKIKYKKNQESIQKQIKKDNIKERQELMNQKIEKNFLDYQKKLKTAKNKLIKKDMNFNEYEDKKMNKIIKFSNLQKENLKKVNNELEIYYNDLIQRHEDNVSIINELQREEDNKRSDALRRIINEQIKKNKEIENLGKFKGKMNNENINNLREDKVKQIFYQKKIEEERKKKEKEEEDYLNKI